MRLANASQSNYDLISRVFRSVRPNYRGDLELYLLEELLRCLKQDDDEASHLVDLYYAEQMANFSN